MFKRLQEYITGSILSAQAELFAEMKRDILRDMYIGFFLERTRYETRIQEHEQTISNLEGLVRVREKDILLLQEELTAALFGAAANLVFDRPGWRPVTDDDRPSS